jgi:hypothetical protein
VSGVNKFRKYEVILAAEECAVAVSVIHAFSRYGGYVFRPINHADRLLSLTFALACVALTIAVAIGGRWVFAGAAVFVVMPLVGFLIGLWLNRKLPPSRTPAQHDIRPKSERGL